MEIAAKDIQQEDFFQPLTIPDNFKKAVGVVQVAMGKLGFLHRKLYNVLLANAYEDLGRGETQFSIQASSLAELSGFESRDYQMIYDHCKELLEATVEFVEFDDKENGKKRPGRKRGATSLITSFAVSDGGVITYSYAPEMAQKLHEPEQYIWMAISAQNRFSSKYELNLFENCIRFIRTGSTGFKDVKSWRAVLGADNRTYDEFKDLNKKVLKPATVGVNSKSGILVEPEFEREKRKVARIKFRVTENPQMQLLDYKKHSRIRGMEAYKNACEVGLKDVEAIYWIELKGEQYLTETIAYVLEKNPKKNPAGYLVNALKQGYGAKSLEQRKQETEAAECLEAHKLQKARDMLIFRMALEFSYWKGLFQKAQKEQDKNLRERLAAQPDQDDLKARFIETLGEDGFRVGDFKKRGWESFVCGTATRLFSAENFGGALLNEATFYRDNKLDFEALKKAHAEMVNSVLYRTRLEDADNAVSGRTKVNLDKVVEQFF